MNILSWKKSTASEKPCQSTVLEKLWSVFLLQTTLPNWHTNTLWQGEPGSRFYSWSHYHVVTVLFLGPRSRELSPSSCSRPRPLCFLRREQHVQSDTTGLHKFTVTPPRCASKHVYSGGQRLGSALLPCLTLFETLCVLYLKGPFVQACVTLRIWFVSLWGAPNALFHLLMSQVYGSCVSEVQPS